MPDPKIDQVVSDVMKREDRTGKGKVTVDQGGRTQFGISEKANPEAWADGKVTPEEAREIYVRKYVKFPKYDLIPDPYVMAQMVDFGVNSGSFLATSKLQEILGVEIDGTVGPQTLAAVQKADPRTLNNQIVRARVLMLGRIVKRDPSQLKDLVGWLDRALSFIR